jgi:hypothetical protein
MRRFFGSTGSVSRVTIESQALKRNMFPALWVGISLLRARLPTARSKALTVVRRG